MQERFLLRKNLSCCLFARSKERIPQTGQRSFRRMVYLRAEFAKNVGKRRLRRYSAALGRAVARETGPCGF